MNRNGTSQKTFKSPGAEEVDMEMDISEFNPDD